MEETKQIEISKQHEEEAVRLLQRLISIDTSNPPGKNCDKLVDFIIPAFKEFGFETQKVVVPRDVVMKGLSEKGIEGERANLVASKKSGKQPLTVYCHMDVVPAGKGWKHNPFAGTVENGKVYGRGSSDMKGSIASLITALKIMKEKRILPAYDLTIVITTDEEIGPYTGLCYLADKGMIKGDMLELDSEADAATISALGCIQFDINVKGKSVHSGLSHMGVNAVENSTFVMNELLELKKKVENRKSKIKANPETGLKNVQSKMNINMIGGGIKINIVPDSCLISVDRRYINEERKEDVKKEMEDTLKKAKEKNPKLEYELKTDFIYDSQATEPDSDIVKRLEDAIKKATGKTPFVGGSVGSGDIAYVAKKLGIRIIGTGVSRTENNFHGDDEFVYIKDVMNLAKVLVLFLSDKQ